MCCKYSGIFFCISSLISPHYPSTIGFNVSKAEKFFLSTLLIFRSILAIKALSLYANMLLSISCFLTVVAEGFFSCAKIHYILQVYFKVELTQQLFVSRMSQLTKNDASTTHGYSLLLLLYQLYNDLADTSNVFRSETNS